MRQKSDKSKLKEKRCLGEGSDYVGFIKANEAKSIGTATEIYDPIADRMVDVLSVGEKRFFWILRYRDDVTTIREQMLMDPNIVEAICREYGFKIPKRCLSTDFLVTFLDDSSVAYSIKADRTIFDKEDVRYQKSPKRYEQLIIRQFIEKEYWQRHGTAFRIVFGNEVNQVLSHNIEACMAFYDSKYVIDTESKLKYLLAHKVIQIPMDEEVLKFAWISKEMKERIDSMYGRIVR